MLRPTLIFQPVRWLSILLFGLLLTHAARPAAAAPPPLRLLPGDTVGGPAVADQRDPFIASSGDPAAPTLLLWTDLRALPPGTFLYEFETSSDIYALRLGADGLPLDAVPFAVTQRRAAQERPQAAWNGHEWLVAYETHTLDAGGYYYRKGLEAQRVTADGRTIGQPIAIGDATTTGAVPFAGSWAIASDGNDWLIAYEGSVSDNALRVVRVNAGGVAQPARVIVPETYYTRYNLRLAFAGDVYLLTYDDMDDTDSVRLSRSGTIIGGPATLVSNRAVRALATNGSQFYAVWTHEPANSGVQLRASRITTAGALLDDSGDNLALETGVVGGRVSAAWSGGRWLVTWPAFDGLRLVRVSADGTVENAGGAQPTTPALEGGPTAADGSGGVFITWSAYANNQSDLFVAQLAAAGSAGPVQTVDTGGPAQLRAASAFANDGSVIVFRSINGNGSRLLVHALDAQGNPRAEEPTLLDSDALPGLIGDPAVAWDGTRFLVSWAHAGTIWGLRLAADGTPIDGAPFAIMTGLGRPAIAGLNGRFLVVARRIESSIQYISAIAARVDGSSAAVLDVTPRLLGIPYVSKVAVTTVGDRWLAVWQYNYSHNNPTAITRGAYVPYDGAASAEFDIYGPYTQNGGNQIFDLTVASDGAAALVVQSNELTSGVEADLVARMVGADGTPGVTVNLTPWSGNQYRPSAAWNGRHYVVVYNDQVNRFAPHALETLDARSDLFGVRVTADGTPLDPHGFALSLSPTAEAYPTLAATADGRQLFAASVLQNAAPHAAYRIVYALPAVDAPIAQLQIVAPAAREPISGAAPLTIDVSADGSSALSGTLVAFDWAFGDGGRANGSTAMHTYRVPGEYMLTLTVRDDGGRQSVVSLPVSVSGAAVPTAVTLSGSGILADHPLWSLLFIVLLIVTAALSRASVRRGSATINVD